MVKKKFSITWKRSKQPRKQRKYRYNAPLHVKQKLMHVHLSPSLTKKYKRRNVQLKKGDKIRVLKGQFRKKEGKVELIILKREKVFVTGLELIKKDGTKVLFPLVPSNLMILDLDLNDRRRKKKLEGMKQGKSEVITRSSLKEPSPKLNKDKNESKNENKGVKNEKSS